MKEKQYTFEEFCDIIRRLRAPDGCPWDRAQTHGSLKQCMLEEAAEAAAAIRIYENTGDDSNLKEELGDVLMQVVMHSQIAREEGRFDVQDVISGISRKMIRRYPHVFGTEEEKAKRGSQFDKELGFKEYGDLAHGLKKITYSCINHNDAVYTYEKKGDIILERLVEFYRDNTLFLPPEYRVENFIHETNEDKKMLQERLICDYISGMMDSYAISQYEKITGEQFSKIVL